MLERFRQIYEGTAGGFVSSSAKTAPIAVTAASVAGVSLQDWMYISTIAFTVLQIAWLAYKFVRSQRGKDTSDG